MRPSIPSKNPDRLIGAAGVAVIHAVLAYVLLTGLNADVVTLTADRLKVFSVPEAPPPPAETVIPAAPTSRQPEGSASAPAPKAQATPVVAPPPMIRLDAPPPVVATALPMPVVGVSRSPGAAQIDEGGTGAGGEGAGMGSGIQGSGAGRRAASRARRVSGSISGAADYPPMARQAGIEGSVVVRFTVQTDGTVTNCRVLRSTASPELDATTCRLIERRFRYEPAVDQAGRPVAEFVSRTFDWMLPFRR